MVVRKRKEIEVLTQGLKERERAKKIILIVYHYWKNLEKYGSPKFRDIAKKVGLAEGTVRYYIRKWKEEEEKKKMKEKAKEPYEGYHEIFDEIYAMVYEDFAKEIGISVDDLIEIIDEKRNLDVFDVWLYLTNLVEVREGVIHDVAKSLGMKPKEFFQLYKTTPGIKRLIDNVSEELNEKICKFPTDWEAKEFWEKKVNNAASLIFNFLNQPSKSK